MPAPTTMNGYPIRATYATPAARGTRSGYVILFEREDRGDFGTTWTGEGDTSWCWGHYDMTEEKARKDFAYRSARGY